jgi:putative DNA primase/helicase
VNRDGIIAANPLPDYLRARGFSLRAAGSNFVSNACPVKEHRRLHLCVTIDTAQSLWHCNDHERGGTIIDWEALEKKIEPAEAMRQLSGGSNGANPPATRPKITATYNYTDEAGELLFQCVRFDPKDFKQRRPYDNGGWIWNMQGVERVLYRLPEVIAAKTIVVVEGEKDADNVRALGFTATTNPLGAKKWRDEYSEVLRGKDVLVFGDDDKDGREHVALIIKSLQDKAKSITQVTFPAPDISDYIKSFSSPDQAKTTIEKLIEQAQPRENSEAKPASPLQKAAVTEQPRVAKVEPPQTPVTLPQWRDLIVNNP